MSKSRLLLLAAVIALVGISLAYTLWQGGREPVPGESPAASIPLPEELAGVKLYPKPELVPAQSFTDESGHEVSLRDFKGKVLVVNLWATWCAPCIREMPDLLSLQKIMEGEDFALVGINQDREGVVAARPFLDDNGLADFTLYTDPAGVMGYVLKAPGLPSTYIVDAEGRMVGSLLGIAKWDAPAVVDYLKAVIAAKDTNLSTAPE